MWIFFYCRLFLEHNSRDKQLTTLFFFFFFKRLNKKMAKQQQQKWSNISFNEAVIWVAHYMTKLSSMPKRIVYSFRGVFLFLYQDSWVLPSAYLRLHSLNEVICFLFLSPPGEPLSSVWVLPQACLLSRLKGTRSWCLAQGEGKSLCDSLGDLAWSSL